jgi:hypothetical protein
MWAEREADRSPPSGPKVQEAGVCTSVFMGWCWILYSDECTYFGKRRHGKSGITEAKFKKKIEELLVRWDKGYFLDEKQKERGMQKGRKKWKRRH